jgi:hypothetical protein
MSARASQMIVWVILASSLVGGCRGRAATGKDCSAVLDRLVDLELAESGFRDRALAEHWKRTLRAQLAPELVRCQGRRVPGDLQACLTAAHSPEEITHRCLK